MIIIFDPGITSSGLSEALFTLPTKSPLYFQIQLSVFATTLSLNSFGLLQNTLIFTFGQ